MEKKLLTVDELAIILRVPRSWVYSRTRQSGPDTIPRVKIGKYVRFEEEKVLRWLEQNQAGAAA